MSLERKDETRLWQTFEESGLVAARAAGFIVAAEVGNAVRNSKVAHREIAASSWFALHPDENSIVRTAPSACWL